MKHIVILMLLSLILASCATTNGYRKFYKQVRGVSSKTIKQKRAAPPRKTPLVGYASLSKKNLEKLDKSLSRQAYEVIGYSSFNSGDNVSNKKAITQAKKVGADLVIIFNPNYTGSRSFQVPFTTPTSTTSHTNGSVTAYGSGGSATVSGSSTTTTNSSTTNYIPMTVNRYDYAAIYLIKEKVTLGVGYRPLNSAERKSLQSNSGVYVSYIINGTPAFHNDILSGDIIKEINGKKIYGGQDFLNILKKLKGQKVSITIRRKDHILNKDVKLNK